MAIGGRYSQPHSTKACNDPTIFQRKTCFGYQYAPFWYDDKRPWKVYKHEKVVSSWKTQRRAKFEADVMNMPGIWEHVIAIIVVFLANILFTLVLHK